MEWKCFLTPSSCFLQPRIWYAHEELHGSNLEPAFYRFPDLFLGLKKRFGLLGVNGWITVKFTCCYLKTADSVFGSHTVPQKAQDEQSTCCYSHHSTRPQVSGERAVCKNGWFKSYFQCNGDERAWEEQQVFLPFMSTLWIKVRPTI